jgi:hypothetical protein
MFIDLGKSECEEPKVNVIDVFSHEEIERELHETNMRRFTQFMRAMDRNTC